MLGLPIETYFPIPDNQEELDSLFTMFNCTIFPWVSSSTPDERIHLFRYALMPVGYLAKMKIPERKMPLWKYCMDTQSFIAKPVLSSIPLFSSTSEVKKTATSSGEATTSSLPSTSSTISKQKLPSTSSGSVKTKMKQLVLEALFPKKRKLDER